MDFKCVKHNNIHGGDQWVFRFDNGFGASVVRHKFSYGKDNGLFEIALIEWDDDDDYVICYDGDKFTDVIGWCDVDQINELLSYINAKDPK